MRLDTAKATSSSSEDITTDKSRSYTNHVVVLLAGCSGPDAHNPNCKRYNITRINSKLKADSGGFDAPLPQSATTAV